ncbi:LacI family transcriptional regulator [Paenibacillus sp. 1_12]|nr:LacI family transcriptional regulator [Paenibacillus sp. 1_12]
MKAQTKLRVQEAAKTLNYHPNAIAQSFARRKSGNLGVILPFLPKVHLFSTYYFSEVLSGIGAKVKDKGYDLLLTFRSLDEESDYIERFRSQKVDACIILGASDTPQEREQLKTLESEGHHFCLVNQHFTGESFNEVDADHIGGSYRAVKHLMDKGHKQIAFLNGSSQFSNSADRYEGYRRAMGEAGKNAEAVRNLYYEGNYSRTSGYRMAAVLYERRHEIDAIFAANDRMAIGLMQGFRELGWEAGRDVAIVGYDDSDAARVTDPPLTSVSVPFYDMGSLAAERLLAQVNGEQGSFQVKLDTELVVRQSCSKIT